MNTTSMKVSVFLFTLVFFFTHSVTPILAAISYAYDANGNMTSDGTKCYEYNEANQVKKVKTCSNNQTIAEYVYDYQGNRLKKKEYENGTLKRTVYSPSDEYETAKIAANNTTQNTAYYFANKELLAKKNPDNTKEYVHNDHLGSSNVISNQSGAKVEETTYDPWGEVKAGGIKSKYQYTGQEKDQETGLNYYNARYYDSHIRRFTQPDDILQDPYSPQTLNRYSYVRNNPLKYTDPTGHIAILPFITMGVASGAISAAVDVYMYNLENPNATWQQKVDVGMRGFGEGFMLGLFGFGLEGIAGKAIGKIGVKFAATGVKNLASSTFSKVTTDIMQKAHRGENISTGSIVDSVIASVVGNKASKLISSGRGAPVSTLLNSNSNMKIGNKTLETVNKHVANEGTGDMFKGIKEIITNFFKPKPNIVDHFKPSSV